MVPYVIPAKEDPRSDGDTPLQELGFGVNDLLFSGIGLSLLAAPVEGRGRLRNRVIVEGNVIIALAKNAGCLQNGSCMLLLTWTYLVSCLFCKRGKKRESSMCDPFCKHPAFLAKAIPSLSITYSVLLLSHEYSKCDLIRRGKK